MRVKAIVQWAALLALAAMGLTVSSVFACDPITEESTGASVVCAPRLWIAPSPTVTPTPGVVAVAANLPRGDSPSSALSATDTWQTLAPGARVWYRLDRVQRSNLKVWLDAYGQKGISMAIYAPEQANALSVNTPPKGHGAYNRHEPNHDLVWVSQSAMGGTWYALITNHNSVSVQYKVGYNEIQTDPKTCISYWEWLPTGEYVYWTWCE